MEIVKIANEIFGYLFYIVYIVLFYASLKICFSKGGKGSARLFFLSLFTNPLILFVASVLMTILAAVLCEVFKSGKTTQAEVRDYTYHLINDSFFISVSLLIGSIISVLLILLISFLVGKHLKAYNRSLVMFVYVMFTVSTIFIDRSGSVSKDTDLPIQFVYSINNIVSVAFFLVLYFFDMKALSKLTHKKRFINWKMFLISPNLFIVGYFVLDYYTYSFCSFDANVVTQILSYIFFFFFIWAFYIIINNIKATDDAIETKEEIKTLSVEVMEALAHTIDAKDEYTRGHSVRVAKYSRMLAERLKLSEEDCENIYYMALLHDIGKIGVPNSIINSPSKLTDEEYTVIKTHPGVGYDILSEIKSRPDLSIGARWHHERYDGKGYPDGKVGDEIPFFARIIAVADSYDAMTSNRSYRKYMPQDAVRSEIKKNIGAQFDPNVAKCMLSIIDEDMNYELHE